MGGAVCKPRRREEEHAETVVVDVTDARAPNAAARSARATTAPSWLMRSPPPAPAAPPADIEAATEELERAFADVRGGTDIPSVHERGLTLAQLDRVWDAAQARCARGAPWWRPTEGDEWTATALDSADVSVRDFLRTVGRPATATRGCSLVEVIAPSAQPAHYFVAHAFDAPLAEVVASVRAHAADRGAPRARGGAHAAQAAPATYWLAALALSEHELAQPMLAWHAALVHTRGALLVLDVAHRFFDSAWCLLETALVSADRPAAAVDSGGSARVTPADAGYLVDVYGCAAHEMSAEAPLTRLPAGHDDGEGGGGRPGGASPLAASAADGGGADGAGAAESTRAHPLARGSAHARGGALDLERDLRVGGLLDGSPAGRSSWGARARAEAFPRAALARAAHCRVEESRGADGPVLLRTIKAHGGAASVNATASARLLLAALPYAEGLGEAERDLISRALPPALAAAELRALRVSFGAASRRPDAGWVARALGSALPPSLEHVHIAHADAAEVCESLGTALRAATAAPPPLRVLELSACSLDDGALCALASAVVSSGARLRVLKLGLNAVGPRGCEALAPVVRAAPASLQQLDLSDNPIGDGGVSALAAALTGSAAPGPHGAAGAEEAGGGPALEILRLSAAGLGADGARALAAVALPSLLRLRLLDLGFNLVGDDGAAEVARALADLPALRTLVLRETGAADSAARALGAALESGLGLSVLSLGSNRVGDDGARALASALARGAPNLAKLNLDGNSIGEAGAIAIARALPSAAVRASLTQLDLSRNWLGVGGAAALNEAAASLHSLGSLEAPAPAAAPAALDGASQPAGQPGLTAATLAMVVDTEHSGLGVSGVDGTRSGAATPRTVVGDAFDLAQPRQQGDGFRPDDASGRPGPRHVTLRLG